MATKKSTVTKIKKPTKTSSKPKDNAVLEKKAAAEKIHKKPNLKSKSTSLPRDLTVSTGKAQVVKAAKTELPKEIFNVNVNMQLIAQAIRVHLANERTGNASTKGRGEVEGSTRKIYRQKGTGKARHGGIRAPIFVGGGIVFGPKPRDYSLKFPRTMRLQALRSILTLCAGKGMVIISEELEKIEPKTRNLVNLLKSMGINESKVLLVTSNKDTSVNLSSRNLPYVSCVRSGDLSTYLIAINEYLVLSPNAVAELQKEI